METKDLTGAVFLDRDGTLIEDVNYLRKKEDIRMLPGAIEAVRSINNAGVPVVIVTNQSVIARGWLTEEELVKLQFEINHLFEQEGTYFDAFYFCPHHPDVGNSTYKIACDCRKPNPGMLFGAAREMNLDLSRSVMIGDSETDVTAGQRAGCKSILLTNSFVPTEDTNLNTVADFTASDILTAVEWALEKICEYKAK